MCILVGYKCVAMCLCIAHRHFLIADYVSGIMVFSYEVCSVQLASAIALYIFYMQSVKQSEIHMYVLTCLQGRNVSTIKATGAVYSALNIQEVSLSPDTVGAIEKNDAKCDLNGV